MYNIKRYKTKFNNLKKIHFTFEVRCLFRSDYDEANGQVAAYYCCN